MVEIIKSKNGKRKKILLILTIPIALIALLIVGNRVISSFNDYFEHQKLIMLDQEAQKIYSAIKAVAPSDEIWKYNTACGENHTGDWPDGTFQCVAISYMEKSVINAEEVQNIHDKYYLVLENQADLVAAGQLEFTHSDTFGRHFVVSSVSKMYSEKKTGFDCRYETYLGQADTTLNGLAYEDDAQIKNNNGLATIMLKCEQKTDKAWYTVVHSTTGMIPDFTPNLDYETSD